jgi:hypothetical protein
VTDIKTETTVKIDVPLVCLTGVAVDKLSNVIVVSGGFCHLFDRENQHIGWIDRY